MKRIIITGASSGIGKATAYYFLNQTTPVELWLISRNIQQLEEIKNEFQGTNHIIHCSSVDVRNKEHIKLWIENVKSTWEDCQLLINNAGLALGTENFQDSSMDDWDTMIDTNVKGLLYTTHAVLPLLKKSKSDRHIINIGSTAGKMVYENGSVYCATKAAVDTVSQGMRIDLLKFKIKVTTINPGMVNTNFSFVRTKGDSEKSKSVYNGYTVLSPEDIAHIIYFTTTLPFHVNINDLTVTCLQQANSVYKLTEDKWEID